MIVAMILICSILLIAVALHRREYKRLKLRNRLLNESRSEWVGKYLEADRRCQHATSLFNAVCKACMDTRSELQTLHKSQCSCGGVCHETVS